MLRMILKKRWDNRCAVIVFDPELEIWIWSDSSVVDKAMGWGQTIGELRDWLVKNHHIDHASAKPRDPKAAFLAALRVKNKHQSASIYYDIANGVSLRKCQDASFNKFKIIMTDWFGL
ncbi:MAG: hypothetical protein M1457_09880 [bacterium]|nr:hypothetical protein [bacterium]